MMKKVLLMSELWPEGCIICAQITESIWNDCNVKAIFVPEHNIISEIEKIENKDLVVGIGYKEMLFTRARLSMIKDKLLLITPAQKKDEYDMHFFNQNFDDDVLVLINEMVSSLNKGVEAVDINRYKSSLKVIENLYRNPEEKLREIISLHGNYYLELLNHQNLGAISSLMFKYEMMKKETDKLISYISPLNNVCFLMVEDQYFFKDDIIIISEKKGYSAIAIQYKEINKYITLYHEPGAETTEYYDGKIEETVVWERITSSNN